MCELTKTDLPLVGALWFFIRCRFCFGNLEIVDVDWKSIINQKEPPFAFSFASSVCPGSNYMAIYASRA